MWPITAANIGTWIGVGSTALGLISAWFYTQHLVRRHDRELGMSESKSLRERVLSLEDDAQNLKEKVDENHEDAKTRHREILGRLDTLASKLEKISEAVWKSVGGRDE